MSLNKRVMVIGIDGATFDLLTPWMKDGRLHNLATLAERGAVGVLQSTMPANSAPAWTSLMTGMNPGKHGIYGFTRLEPQKGYAIKINSGANRRAPTVWEYLTTRGRRSIVLNMPMTYPPTEIDGIVVTGITTPGLESQFTYPPALGGEIRRRFPNYMLDVRNWGVTTAGERRAHLMENIAEMVESRRRLALHLLETESWDLFALIFTATDRVMHFFWRYLDSAHPLYDAAEAPLYRDAILRIHQQIDDAIGEVLAHCDEETAVIIMSDHGFGPQHKLFRINQWLIENQFLRLRFGNQNGSGPSLRGGAQKWVYRRTDSLVEWLRGTMSDATKDRLKRSFPRMRERVASQTLFTGVDWAHTFAYHTAEFPGSLRVNMRGRETAGVVAPGVEYERVCSELQAGLEALIDPETGRRVVERVFRREELYDGPFLPNAPDLIVHLADYAYTIDWYIPTASGKQSLPVLDQLHGKYAVNCGYHRPDGIFMAVGKGIRAGWLAPAQIVDVAPTLLYLLGEPIPEDMDGWVLEKAFEPDILTARAIRYGARVASAEGTAVARQYTTAEEDAVAERLHDLGYL